MTHSSAHNKEVSKTEVEILNHLAQHDDQKTVFHALDLLKEYDARHGRNFNKDLAKINQKLHWDMATQDLPTVTIQDYGRSYAIHNDALAPQTPDGQPVALPDAVLKAIEREQRANHGIQNVQGGRFLKPSYRISDDTDGMVTGRPTANDEASMPHVPGKTIAFNPDGKSQGDKPMGPVHGDKCPSRNGFAVNLLERLGMPVTSQNLAFLDAWQRAEGGSADNPFNTTQRMPGHERTINHDGVKRYDSMDVGLEATAKTLSYDRYRGIIHALKQGTSAHACAKELARSAWGTGDLVTQMV